MSDGERATDLLLRVSSSKVRYATRALVYLAANGAGQVEVPPGVSRPARKIAPEGVLGQGGGVPGERFLRRTRSTALPSFIAT